MLLAKVKILVRDGSLVLYVVHGMSHNLASFSHIRCSLFDILGAHARLVISPFRWAL